MLFLRRFLAVLAGVLAIFVLSLGTDTLLERTVLPGLAHGQATVSGVWMFVTASIAPYIRWPVRYAGGMAGAGLSDGPRADPGRLRAGADVAGCDDHVGRRPALVSDCADRDLASLCLGRRQDRDLQSLIRRTVSHRSPA